MDTEQIVASSPSPTPPVNNGVTEMVLDNAADEVKNLGT